MAGVTTGAPVALRIVNRDHDRWMGRAVAPMTVPRPGHADLAAAIKYGYEDLRFGLERASARETAARAAAGAVCRRLLAEFAVTVRSRVTAIGGARPGDVQALPDAPALDPLLQGEIEAAAREGETAGGVFEVIAEGVPPGLGSHQHWDRRLTGRLCGALASVPGVKGVEVGDAFESAATRGSRAHDGIATAAADAATPSRPGRQSIDPAPGLPAAPSCGGEGERERKPRRDGAITRTSNRAGGIEGGITNGETVVVRAAMKPIATTRAPMPSVDLTTGGAALASYERSDVCAVPRAAVVGEAMVCLVLADALLEKLGGDSIAEMKPRFAALRKARLDDLEIAPREWIFWP